MCDKVLNSSFLSRTCDSALSLIFPLSSLSFLHTHALSPLLNTPWPLNLMPWCPYSCALSHSFLRALFVTRIPPNLSLSCLHTHFLPMPFLSWTIPLLHTISFFLTLLLCAIHTPIFSCPYSCFLVFCWIFFSLPYFPCTLPFSHSYFFFSHSLSSLSLTCAVSCNLASSSLCFFALPFSSTRPFSCWCLSCTLPCDFLHELSCSLAFNPALSCTHSFLWPPAFSRVFYVSIPSDVGLLSYSHICFLSLFCVLFFSHISLFPACRDTFSCPLLFSHLDFPYISFLVLSHSFSQHCA